MHKQTKLGCNFRYCLDEFLRPNLNLTETLNKYVLVVRAKDVEKGGSPCSNDSGSGLFVKKGNKFVLIGQ